MLKRVQVFGALAKADATNFKIRKAVDLELTDAELSYLEEPYVPHPLAGVMAQNKPANAKENMYGQHSKVSV